MFDEISEAHCVSYYGSFSITVRLRLIILLSWNAGVYELRVRFSSNDTFYRTFMPLLESLPLHDHQLKSFSVNSTFEAMRTGPVPWVGLLVDFVKGEYKTEHGAVRDVNRYAVDSQNPQGRSGLTLTVERYTFSANSSNRLVKVDYNAVRYHKYVFPFRTGR